MTEIKQTKKQSPLLVKLFIGFPLTTEIKMHLSQSESWKQEQAIASSETTSLQTIWYKEKEFIGIFFEQSSPSIKEVKSLEQQIIKLLSSHSSELNVGNFSRVIFPQIFLS